MSPALIAIDWGSSSFRAYLMSAEGEVLDEVASSDGIGSVAAGAYPATLKRLIGQWLEAHPSLPVIASGMVGSRHGWREAAYVECPAGPRDVAAHLTEVEADGRRVVLAPGLSYIDEAGQPDVMRGEETEILRRRRFGRDVSSCCPARIRNGRGSRAIASSRSRPSSPANCLRRCGTTRSPAPSPGPRPPRVRERRSRSAFERGAAAAGGEGKSGLLGLLFGARSLPLMGGLAEDDAGEYLSGLLIGAEIGEGRRLYPGEEPHVAGAEALVKRYLEAFEALGVFARAAPARAAARGLFWIARDGGLL